MSLHENIVITKQEEQEHQKCTICWNKMKSSYTTSCNHEFCHKCIKKNIETYEATSCPICRYQFNEVELHSIKIYKKPRNVKKHQKNKKHTRLDNNQSVHNNSIANNTEIARRPITRSQTRLQRMNEITNKIINRFTFIFQILQQYEHLSNTMRLYFIKNKIDFHLEKVFSLLYNNSWYIKKCNDNNEHIIENIKDLLMTLLKNGYQFYDSKSTGFNLRIWIYKFREIGIFMKEDFIIP